MSKAARLTGTCLWSVVDDEGRAEVRPNLIAGAIYPGDPTVTPEMIEEHLLELMESGFLLLYQSQGREWMQLRVTLMTQRPRASEHPEPPSRLLQEVSGKFLAQGGACERAQARADAEAAERASGWATWEQEQETRTTPPPRPMLLDAPPQGCPDHPDGRFAACGPCGTARRRHDRWLIEQRYLRDLAEFEETQNDQPG